MLLHDSNAEMTASEMPVQEEHLGDGDIVDPFGPLTTPINQKSTSKSNKKRNHLLVGEDSEEEEQVEVELSKPKKVKKFRKLSFDDVSLSSHSSLTGHVFADL